MLIIPFKDPTGASGVVGIEAEEIGIYSEKPEEYAAALVLAASRHTRLLLGHDSPAVWTIPSGLRPWDIPFVEFYRLPSETLVQSVSRWRALLLAVLAQWPGDCGVIPMFYCQGGVPGGNPPELWTVQEVLDGLAYLSPLVNLSPRLKIVAPFAYQRANGITAHPELRAAFALLLKATPGRPAFTVISAPTPAPTPEPHPEPPMPTTIPPISDDEIIELAMMYDQCPTSAGKSEGDYLRDGGYYGVGYMRLRAMGLSHVAAMAVAKDAAFRDDWYDPSPAGMPPDDEIIDLRARWVARYQEIGRYQQQSRFENVRDLIYWLIVYCRAREAGKGHEAALRTMERGMNAEAGLPDPFPPETEPVGTLTTDGPYFIRDWQLWWWSGLTAFLLLKRFLTGRRDDALRYMDWAEGLGVNVLRVFSQVDWDGSPTGGVEVGFFARDFADYDARLHEMCTEAAARGLYIETVAHTFADDLDAMVAHSRRIDAITSAHVNGLFEDANEPQVNGIPIDLLVQRFTPRTLASSGQYDPSPYPARSWVNDHPPRDAEFCRKFKGSIEYADGSGPYAPFSPPWRGPVVLDEPARIESMGTPDDWRAFGAGARLFGAGATIHGGVWAQTCQVPTDAVTLEKITAFLDGVRAVPLQRYSGYSHPPDQGSLRRYRRHGADGKTYEISVRPFAFTEV